MSLMQRLLGGRGKDAAPACTIGGLEIREPWARLPSPDATQAGGFFTVENKGADADRLVGATSPLAGSVEIHAIKVVGGNITMRPLADGLRLPAGVALTLRPRGYHLLLQGLGVSLRPGARLPLVVTFEKAGVLAIELDVREDGPVGQETLRERP